MTLKPLSVRSAFKSRHNPEDWALLARVYWLVVLTLSVLAAVGGICLGVWILLSALGIRESAEPTLGRGAESLDRAQLSTTLQLFEARRARFNDLSSVPAAKVATSTAPAKAR